MRLRDVGILRATLTAFLDAVTPHFCVLCGSLPGGLPWLCDACLDGLDLRTGPCCLRCGAPRPLTTPTCEACPDWPKRLVVARAAAPHVGTARALVHALKYRRMLAAAQPLAHMAVGAARLLRLPAEVVVVPVPLHPARRRQRGFNQAEEIARVVAAQLGLPLRARWLRRVRDDAPSIVRTRAGRRRAVRGAFRAAPKVRRRAVLLIDDVMTTGATVGSAARAMARKGVGDVFVVTATRSR